MTPTLPPFVRPSLLHAPTFCRMLYGPSRFLSDMILTLRWSLKKRVRSWKKSLHCHTIPSFTSPKSPFGSRLGSRETPPVTHLSTEDQHYQRWAALTVWDQYRPSTLRHDSKTGELARRSRRRAKLFLLDHYRSKRNRAYLSSPPWKLSRRGAMRSRQAAWWARTQLFKKPQPGAQFHWEQISSCDQPSCSSSGSEAVPTTNSRYSSFIDCERSLDSGRLRRNLWHSVKNSVSPLSLRQLSAFGLDFKRGKDIFTFSSPPYLSSMIDPEKLIFQ